MTAHLITKAFNAVSDPHKASELQRFFKTAPGEYGEGDLFYGVKVPETRKIAQKFKDLPYEELEKLIRSKMHEEKMCALVILVNRFSKKSTPPVEKEIIFNFYMTYKRQINNWDLVDISAPKIVGPWLSDKNKRLLYELADSKIIWDRRIAVLSTFHFIREYEFKHTLKLATKLLNDSHDLMHKAVGWMLREIGKREQKILEDFLGHNIKAMPRTMVRYAIEKLPESLRKYYLNMEK